MVIQAAGARRSLRSDPARARQSILAVERTGRDALADLRRLLGVLRKDEDPRALFPQPGLDQVAALLDAARADGACCELRVEGMPLELMPGINLVGYRVIEATLHAASQRGAATVVIIGYQRDRIELRVLGEGAALSIDRDLHDIAQRVALYDGQLRTLTLDGGGYAVVATLPVIAS